jgi:hypothetical protein
MPTPENASQKPTNAAPRESADEKMVKALLHQAMKKVLEKRDTTLLAVAQQMIDSGDVREQQSMPNVFPTPEKHLSDEELLTILDRNIGD